jgi:hypothetical protein
VLDSLLAIAYHTAAVDAPGRPDSGATRVARRRGGFNQITGHACIYGLLLILSTSSISV